MKILQRAKGWITASLLVFHLACYVAYIPALDKGPAGVSVAGVERGQTADHTGNA